MLNWSEYEPEHVQETRAHWLRLFWHIACCASLGVILALAVREARADVASSPTGDVKLERHQAACDDADILAHVLRMGGAHVIDKLKKATLTYGGREWRSCWVEIDGYVFSVDEEGAPLQKIPASAFKDKSGGA